MIYQVSARFPAAERYGLTQQLRRASVSVSSNIAEGVGRGAPREMLTFLRIARGSLQETRSQLDLAVRLNYVSAMDVALIAARADEISRMLSGLMRTVSAQSMRDPVPK
jgi:four helix bundle protein